MARPDNVTPFRPRRPVQRPAPSNPLKSHRGKAVLVHVLTLVALTVTSSAAIFLLFPPLRRLGQQLAQNGWWLSYVGLAFAIAVVAIAATNRREGMPWAVTHHEFALRTILIGAAIATVAQLLLLLPIPFLSVPVLIVLFAVALWVLFRAGAALVLACLRKPIPHPKGWLL